MANDQSKPGTVITFYSYKGGTGRSMALVNIACLIGKQLFESSQRRVLAVDWDLEAPGLHKFFARTQQSKNEKCPGLINYFYALRDLLTKRKDLYKKIDLYQKTKDKSIFPKEPWAVLEKELPIDEYIIHQVERGVDLIKAGQLNNPKYSEQVNSFNWFEFYNQFGSAIDIFRELLASKYVYCLIDSRTGITDISGICTMLLPEKLVGVYTSNNQSVDGLIDVIRQAIDYRAGSNDLRPLAIFPLASRIDDAEKELQEKWRLDYQKKFQGLFREAYEIEECDLTEYFGEVKLPHKSYYSYGERIAVLEERNEAFTLSRAYHVFFKYLLGLSHTWQPLKETDLTTRPTVFLAEVTDDLGNLRNEVREYLILDKIRVLPETSLYSHYLSGSDSVQEVLAKELANCQLFVQLLSHMPGKHPPGQTSFPQLQYEVARKAQKHILQWRDPELKLNTVKDNEQRALLTGENVWATSLEEFKREVVTRVKVQPTLPQERLGLTGRNKLVFIDVHEKDLLLGKDISRELVANGMGVILPSLKAKPAERDREWKLSLMECNALIIVYGEVPATWVKTRLLRSRRVISERNQPLEALAICEGPHLEKEPLDIEFPNMITINYQGSLDKSKLQSFLDALGVYT